MLDRTILHDGHSMLMAGRQLDGEETTRFVKMKEVVCEWNGVTTTRRMDDMNGMEWDCTHTMKEDDKHNPTTTNRMAIPSTRSGVDVMAVG